MQTLNLCKFKDLIISTGNIAFSLFFCDYYHLTSQFLGEPFAETEEYSSVHLLRTGCGDIGIFLLTEK